jgi:hypothetical protein
MRIILLSVFITVFASTIFAQNRQETIEQFNNLKNQAQVLERKILSPDKKDIETAMNKNVGVFRILPRETYDNGLFSTRGGGAYYSFYFRIPDYGHGSDLGFEQNYLQTGFNGCGLMTDFGEVPLGEIKRENVAANSLANYQNAKNSDSCRSDYYLASADGLKLDQTVFRSRLPAVVGHTYLVRSTVFDYYDVLVAFRIERKDADGSLVIFWKQLEQFETKQRTDEQKTQASDDEILLKTKSFGLYKSLPNFQTEVTNGVITLRGKIPRDKLAYAVQLANSTGAIKVINLLEVE